MDIAKANKQAVDRMIESRPVLVGVGKARDVIPGPGRKREPPDPRRPAHHLGPDVGTDARRRGRGIDL